MSEQNSIEPTPFSVQKASPRGSLHLLHSRKLLQLKGKANFFQGQLDPLHTENTSLKQQLMSLTKNVSSCTQLLKNLLPISQNPIRRLKLQLANLQQVAVMIRNDWLEMEEKLGKDREDIEMLEKEKGQWRVMYGLEREMRVKEVGQIKEEMRNRQNQFQCQLAWLKKELIILREKNEVEKKQIYEQFAEKINSFEIKERQFQKFRRQAKDKDQQNQKCISRLRSQIQANLISFQQSKKNIKAIYDKLMTDKLAEQAEGFELMLRIREEEKVYMTTQMMLFEEEVKRKIAQKQTEIASLNQHNRKHCEDINTLKENLWRTQKQLEKQQAQTVKVTNELQSKNIQIQRRIKQAQEKERLWEQEKIRLQSIIKKRQRQIEIIQSEGSSAIDKLLKQKQTVENELVEKQKKLRQTLLSLRKIDDEWTAKMQKQQQEWINKQSQLQNNINESMRLHAQEIQKNRLAELQKQLLISDYQFNISEIKQKHKNRQEELNNIWNSKLTAESARSEEQKRQLKVKHEREMVEANISANEQMRMLMVDCNRKLTEYQTKLLVQQQMFQKTLQQIKQERAELQNRLQAAQQVIKQHSQEVERLKSEHCLAIKRLQQLNEQQMKKQLLEFQKTMEEKQALLSSLRNGSEIQNIQNRFMAEINKMKEQFQLQLQQQADCNKKQVLALVQSHQNAVTTLKQAFNQDLIKIAQNVEQTSTFLNDKLLADDNDHQMEQMNTQQKKQHIVHKIDQLKEDSKLKDQKIIEMEYAIEELQGSIDQKVKARKQELERQQQRFIKNCNKRIQNTESQCRAKVTAAQLQKMQHTQLMYEQFHKMKAQSDLQFNFLKQKYKQLQKLFQQRPSRAEDLTKIKQLINMQTIMDVQIQAYHKKMETANEIVKYLNLQLQNYKDTYDIFSPSAQGNQLPAIVGVGQHYRQPISESQNLIEALRSRRQESQQKVEQRKGSLKKQQISFRKWNDSSPLVKQLKIFAQNQNGSSSIVLNPIVDIETKEKHYSNLMNDKTVQKYQRIRTQKSEEKDNQSQIIRHASNFLRLIQGGKEESIIQQTQKQHYSRRKSYRKRKLNKRHPTIGTQHYF